MTNLTPEQRIQRALDYYYTLEMRDEPVSAEDALEEIVSILEGMMI